MTDLYDTVSRGALLQAQVRPVAFKVTEARSMAASGADEAEIRTFAITRADAANGLIETEAQEREAILDDQLGFEDRQTDAFRVMSESERYIEQGYERHADPKYAQTWSEWMVNRYYTVVRYGSLGLAITVMAWIIMESGRSAMLSGSFVNAVIYSSALILIPSMLTSLSALSTDLRWQRRLLRLYAIPAVFFGVVWIVSAAILFAGLNSGFGGSSFGGASGGLFEDPVAAPASILGQIMAFLVGLFVDPIFGPLVLGSHILSDVFSSSAIGMRQQIVHKTARRAVAIIPAKFEKTIDMLDGQRVRQKPDQEERTILRGVLRKCEVEREAAVSTFGSMVSAEKKRLTLQRDAAAAAAMLEFMDEDDPKPMLRVVG